MDRMTCFECEQAQLERIAVNYECPLSEGRSILVQEVVALKCPSCGAECFDNAASVQIEAAIEAKYPGYFKQRKPKA